jgi:hypothetical protein
MAIGTQGVRGDRLYSEGREGARARGGKENKGEGGRSLFEKRTEPLSLCLSTGAVDDSGETISGEQVREASLVFPRGGARRGRGEAEDRVDNICG